MDKRKLNRIVRDVKKILVLAKSAHDHLEKNQIRKARRELERVMSYDADEITRLHGEDEGMAHQLFHECGVVLKDAKQALRDLDSTELFDKAKELVDEIVKLEGHELIELEEVEHRENELYEFWYSEIKDREIYHGTSTLYYEHIKKYGLSAKKPFNYQISKIIAFCTRYREFFSDAYFWWFVERFLSEENIFSFTFNLEIAEGEFARGPRSGGEYIRSLNHFILNLNRAIRSGRISLSKGDLEQKSFLEEFLRRADEHKGMIIAVKCSCPDLEGSMAIFALGSYKTFINHIKRQRALKSKNAEDLKTYFREAWTNPAYEVTVRRPINFSNMRIIFFD